MLVIDEMSMLGRRCLGAIDARLRQLFPERKQEWFGGVSVVLMGDFGQLPPVLDLPMYAKAARQGLSGAGKKVFAAFKQAIVLDKVERIAGDTPEIKLFTEVLGRLRKGKVTRDDWQFLIRRSFDNLNPDEKHSFEDAQILASTHQAEEKVNSQRLQSLPDTKVNIHAVNAGPHSNKTSTEDAGGLQNVLQLAKGARVMLRQNLWVEAGLTNGALGTVTGILYDPNGAQPPALPVVVLVTFDIYTGPSFLPDILPQGTVPIPPQTIRWLKGQKMCTRTQVPLCLAFAVTIHKSQGWTRDKVMLDIGTSEHSLGITFVGCSRVKSPEGLCLLPSDISSNTWARFEKINKAKGHEERRNVDNALIKMHNSLQHA